MRSLAVPLAGLLLAAAPLASAGTVSVPFTREARRTPSSLRRRDGTLDLVAINNITDGGYYAEFGVGTPPQTISFHLDTGSSDTWVNSNEADLCNSEDLQIYNGYCQQTCRFLLCLGV